MKVLVTGAAGFLGRRFVRHHLEAGHDVVGIDDLSSHGSFWPEGLEDICEGDVAEFLPHVGPVDLAYHFAAPVGGREKIEGDPLFNADSLRLDATFFRWAAQGLAAQVVYPSSSAVYGVSLQGPDSAGLVESLFHPGDPTWLAPDEMYGFTKLAGEVLAWKSAAYGVNTLCIRPFSGYGEGQSFDYPVPSIARRALRREDPLVIWGSGSQTRDFVHVDDIVGATTQRLRGGVTGYEAYNIGSGVEFTFGDIAQMCAEIVGYKPKIVTDKSKPQGVVRRYSLTATKGYWPEVGISEGLERVIEWIAASS